MKLHPSVVTAALKVGAPLRRDDKGYYHIGKRTQRLDWTITHRAMWVGVYNPTGKTLTARTEAQLMSKINAFDAGSTMTSITTTAASGLALLRKWKKRKTRKNPISAARRDDAVAKFELFHDSGPQQIIEITIDELPAAVWSLGELVEVKYYAPNFEGKPTLFHHKFRATARPLLTVTPEKKLFIAGGRYQVDDRRGIVDQR